MKHVGLFTKLLYLFSLYFVGPGKDFALALAIFVIAVAIDSLAICYDLVINDSGQHALNFLVVIFLLMTTFFFEIEFGSGLVPVLIVLIAGLTPLIFGVFLFLAYKLLEAIGNFWKGRKEDTKWKVVAGGFVLNATLLFAFPYLYSIATPFPSHWGWLMIAASLGVYYSLLVKKLNFEFGEDWSISTLEKWNKIAWYIYFFGFVATLLTWLIIDLVNDGIPWGVYIASTTLVGFILYVAFLFVRDELWDEIKEFFQRTMVAKVVDVILSIIFTTLLLIPMGFGPVMITVILALVILLELAVDYWKYKSGGSVGVVDWMDIVFKIVMLVLLFTGIPWVSKEGQPLMTTLALVIIGGLIIIWEVVDMFLIKPKELSFDDLEFE